MEKIYAKLYFETSVRPFLMLSLFFCKACETMTKVGNKLLFPEPTTIEKTPEQKFKETIFGNPESTQKTIDRNQGLAKKIKEFADMEYPPPDFLITHKKRQLLKKRR